MRHHVVTRLSRARAGAPQPLARISLPLLVAPWSGPSVAEHDACDGSTPLRVVNLNPPHLSRGSHATPARRLQPLLWRPALPPKEVRTLPDGRGDAPAQGGTIAFCGSPASRGDYYPPASSHRVPRERNPVPPVVGLSRGGLVAPNGKTRLSSVWLSEPARKVLCGLDRSSRWVFPARRGDRPRDGKLARPLPVEALLLPFPG